MEYRYLGNSGLQVSSLSFGSWVTFGSQLDERSAHDCMLAARQAGVNLFDNAEVYANGASEQIMGSVLRRAGWKRSELVITTKLFWGGSGPNQRGLSRKHIREGTEASLARLGLEYVDLLYCHRPDPATGMEEIVRAMNFVIDRGWALYWGTSEWSAEQLRQAWHIADRCRLIGPIVEQPQYNVFHRERVEREYLPLYDSPGLGLTTWSPLASGLLSGKYNDGQAPAGSRATLAGMEWLQARLTGALARERLPKVRAFCDLAQRLNATPSQLAIAWCLRNPRVSSVITGASNPDQVEQNMRAADLVARLSPELLQQIDVIFETAPDPVPDFRRMN